MAKHTFPSFSCAFSLFVLATSLFCNAIADQEDRKTYIVYLGSLPHDEVFSPMSHQIGILESVLESDSASNVLLRSYKRSFNGFAANLTESERARLVKMKGVVSVFPNRYFHLQTTRSWDFLGLSDHARRSPTVESDVIIGVIDSGISPDSKSFTDEGFGPAPKKWKGECDGGKDFTCNNKIIGVRRYSSSSARDEIGHGTHTASTAAGNAVKDSSFFGIAQGTARGAVPSARIAAYKVCDTDQCSTEAILAAFDDAIADGVDILTVSLGGSRAAEFDQDPVSIGAFHAMKKGILTANSAGNSGPYSGTVSSVAPWILSVAASSTDRRIVNKVVLGNGRTLVGNAVNSFKLNGTRFPLINGEDASSQCASFSAQSCQDGCLDPDRVKGKIVVCDTFEGIKEVVRVGALGSILKASRDDVAVIVPLPAATLSSDDFDIVQSYASSTKNAKANILKSEALKDSAAPLVASFSSRGPNTIVSDIIKPDISAPGVDILAAYSPIAPVSEETGDHRHVKYSVLSGTSMSCPHAAGVAAYIRTFHPDWSPSAIKSSLMTTASPMNATDDSPGEFSYGSGHINPLKARDPGLVYETSADDYIKLLCSVLDEEKVQAISGEKNPCPAGSTQGSPKDLNYPSLSAVVAPSEDLSEVKFHRTVKNVGAASSTYKAKILTDSQVDIKVEPQVLSFTSLNEEKSFTVTVSGFDLSSSSYVSASLVWSDGTTSVRSPILLRNAGSSD